MKNNPYYTVWLNPTKTVLNVLSDRIKFRFQIPIFIAAISGTLSTDVTSEFGFGVIGSTIVLIPVIGISYLILTYLYPWSIMITGKLLKGKSNFRELQLTIGLASIPIFLTLIYQLLRLSLSESISSTEVNYAIQFIVWIFYIRTLIIGISKSQKFSYGFALVNIFICAFPFIILKLIVG
jgi:hypothetical protein